MQSPEHVSERPKGASLREGFVIDARESIEILTCPSDSFLTAPYTTH